jgi:hypothetical protein
MSDITIKSEKDLRSFLRLVSEEAYKKSIKEANDPFVSKYSQAYKQDETRYGSLDEVEEDEAGIEDQDVAEEEPVDTEANLDSEVTPVSFDSIKKAIKVLRSGKSVDSETVDDGLNVYYDRLDEEERLVLFTFLDELSKIMNLSIDGSEAQDPGDPPLNIDFVTGEQEADAGAEKAAADVEEDLPDEEPEDEEEDVSPPIEVNESQNKAMLRRKIRYLMSK